MSFEQLFEERTACRENRLVSLDSLILTGQGDIGEVAVTSEFSERILQICLEIVPLQTQFFILHTLYFVLKLLKSPNMKSKYQKGADPYLYVQTTTRIGNRMFRIKAHILTKTCRFKYNVLTNILINRSCKYLC